MSLKTIFGWGVSYIDCLQLAGIDTLQARREEIFKKFTWKAFESERYGPKWFEQKSRSNYALRKEDKVVQKFAHRDRLKNAPCYKMRELINKEARR